MTSPTSTSLGAGRRELIVGIVRERGHVVIAELAAELGVSEMTVRRDVAQLSDEERVISFYGGVRSPQLELVPNPFHLRAEQESLAKTRIAERAAQFVAEGSVIAIDAGSTAAKLAQQPIDRSGLRVVTASVPVITTFMEKGTVDVVALGGTLRREMQSFIGPSAAAAANDLQVETYFLGASALSERGLFDITNLDSTVKRELIGVSQRVIAIADSTKFGRRAMSRTCTWQPIHTLVTDDRIDEASLTMLREQDVDVILVDTDQPA